MICTSNQKLHFRIKKKVDRKINETQKEVPVNQIDDYIQEALSIYVSRIAERAEVDQRHRNNLKLLERKGISSGVLERNKNYDVVKLPDDYWYKLRTVVIGSRDCPDCKKCKGRELKAVYAQSSDLNESNKSPYLKSNFEYEESIVDEGEKGLYVYHYGDFKVDQVLFDYYRKPVDPKTPNLQKGAIYKDSSGQAVTDNVCFELVDSYQLDDIADLAALLIEKDRGSVDDYQTRVNQIIFKENI